jgi:hypothetical protein
LNTRKLITEDWDILLKWWEAWPEWVAPTKDFLPDNGTFGLMVEKDGIPVVAGFIYLTNSKTALLEWIVSNPEYREEDRDIIIEKLISDAEHVVKDLGYKYMFAVMQHKKLIETHEKLGWNSDKKPSFELTKIL